MISKKILILAAHPDDEVLGCGGTINYLTSKGCEIRVVFMAEGITARYEVSQFKDKKVLQEVEERNNNSLKALNILGVKRDIHFLSNVCCRMDQMSKIDLAKSIEKHINSFKPNTILTHSPNDLNVDHVMTFEATLVATRPIKNVFESIFSFEVLSSSEWNLEKPFNPNFFVNITNHVEKKCKALAAYDNEMKKSPHPRSTEVIKALAKYRGAQVGVDYAEGFRLVRKVLL